MPTPTTNLALNKPVGADNARDVDKVYIANAFDTIDAHTHAGTGTLGLKIATSAIPSGATVPAPIITGHEHVSGSAPTVAAQAALGGGTATVTGSDGHHVVILTPAGGGGLAAGVQAIVTFAGAFVTPHVIISPHGNPPPGAGSYTASITTTTYSIAFATVGVNGTPYTLYVQVVDLG